MGLAMSLYEMCRKEIDKYGPGRLRKIRLAIGELAAVEPELLKFAWKAAIEGADAECELEIEWRPATQFCAQCKAPKERPKDGWLMTCPDCGAALSVEGGYEMDLLQISFDSDDEAGGSPQ
jgi:hydrogenase nickel incorporation protein HypA/HybF